MVLDNNETMVILKIMLNTMTWTIMIKKVVMKNYDKDDGLGSCLKRGRYIERDSQLLRQQCAATEREGGNYKEQNTPFSPGK